MLLGGALDEGGGAVAPGARAGDKCLLQCSQMLDIQKLAKVIIPCRSIAAKRHTAEVALRRGDAARAQVERTRRASSLEGIAPAQREGRKAPEDTAGRKAEEAAARGKRVAVPPPRAQLST